MISYILALVLETLQSMEVFPAVSRASREQKLDTSNSVHPMVAYPAFGSHEQQSVLSEKATVAAPYLSANLDHLERGHLASDYLLAPAYHSVDLDGLGVASEITHVIPYPASAVDTKHYEIYEQTMPSSSDVVNGYDAVPQFPVIPDMNMVTAPNAVGDSQHAFSVDGSDQLIMPSFTQCGNEEPTVAITVASISTCSAASNPHDAMLSFSVDISDVITASATAEADQPFCGVTIGDNAGYVIFCVAQAANDDAHPQTDVTQGVSFFPSSVTNCNAFLSTDSLDITDEGIIQSMEAVDQSVDIVSSGVFDEHTTLSTNPIAYENDLHADVPEVSNEAAITPEKNTTEDAAASVAVEDVAVSVPADEYFKWEFTVEEYEAQNKPVEYEYPEGFFNYTINLDYSDDEDIDDAPEGSASSGVAIVDELTSMIDDFALQFTLDPIEEPKKSRKHSHSSKKNKDALTTVPNRQPLVAMPQALSGKPKTTASPPTKTIAAITEGAEVTIANAKLQPLVVKREPHFAMAKKILSQPRGPVSSVRDVREHSQGIVRNPKTVSLPNIDMGAIIEEDEEQKEIKMDQGSKAAYVPQASPIGSMSTTKEATIAKDEPIKQAGYKSLHSWKRREEIMSLPPRWLHKVGCILATIEEESSREVCRAGRTRMSKLPWGVPRSGPVEHVLTELQTLDIQFRMRADDSVSPLGSRCINQERSASGRALKAEDLEKLDAEIRALGF